MWVAIWPYARPNKSKLAFLIALGLEVFGLAFWLFLAFLGQFGLEDFCLALMLFFGFILAFSISTPSYRSTTIEVTELPPKPNFRYHTLTV